jgi:hypothetical protein
LGSGHIGDALMLVQLGRVANNSYVKDVDGGPPRRGFRESGAPTTYVRDVDVGPLGGDVGVWEVPPPMSEMSMAGPLGGDVSCSRVPTTYVGDVDGGAPSPLGGSGLQL